MDFAEDADFLRGLGGKTKDCQAGRCLADLLRSHFKMRHKTVANSSRKGHKALWPFRQRNATPDNKATAKLVGVSPTCFDRISNVKWGCYTGDILLALSLNHRLNGYRGGHGFF